MVSFWRLHEGSQGRGVEAADARPGSGQTDQSAVDPGDGGAVGGAVLQGGGPVRAAQVTISILLECVPCFIVEVQGVPSGCAQPFP